MGTNTKQPNQTPKINTFPTCMNPEIQKSRNEFKIAFIL